MTALVIPKSENAKEHRGKYENLLLQGPDHAQTKKSKSTSKRGPLEKIREVQVVELGKLQLLSKP